MDLDSLRVVIADDESIIRLDLKEMLVRMGHQVVAEAGDGQRAIELVREVKPQLVVLDIKMPVLDGIDAAKIISQEKLAPVLLLTAYSQMDLVKRAMEAGVFGYVVKPFTEAELSPAMSVAIARFSEFSEISRQASDLQDALETRKVLDRAKGILMDKYNLRERDAFRRIQQISMNSRKSMREIADAICLADEVGAGD